MHNYNKIIISCTALMLALCNCSSGDEYGRNATGKITLAVEADKTIAQSVVSRATTPHMPVLNSLTPDKLTVSLTNKSGSYSHTWSSHNEFPEDEEFPADTYTMTASYGNTDAEGFESPQLYGEVSFPVVAGKVTPVRLTATVANSLIMFEPTEKFLDYFQSARFVLNTAAGNSLVVNPGETRPVYINPGNARIDARVVMPSGADALITIGYFTAKKATLHRITLDVEASTGTATLTVNFYDTFSNVEPITIDLTKDLESLVPLPIPVVTPEGFEGNSAVDLRETYSGDYAFNIATRAGLAAATLSVADGDGEPEVYNMLDDKHAESLANKGLRTLNLKPDCEFSKIYLKDFVASLRCKSRDANSSKTITLSVTDRLGRTTDQTLAGNNTLKVNLSPVTLSIEAVKDVIVHPTYQVKVQYNGSDIEKWMKFNTISKTGTKVSANPVKIEPGTNEDEYLCTFNTPFYKNNDQSNDYSKFKIESEFTENANSVSNIIIPDYQVTIDRGDVWTKKAALYITPRPGNEEYISDILDNLTISGKGSEHIKSREGANTVFDITDLNPATKYNLTFSLNNYNPTTKEFTTEEELQLPNSNMESWYSELAPHSQTSFYGADAYRWYANSKGDDFWATRNALTTSTSNGPTPNYVSYSGTRSTSGFTGLAAEICTIGYGEGSTYTGRGGTCKHTAAGMLFVGNHSAISETSETITYGKPFTSRPSGFTFKYKYAPYNNESFKAYIVIENRSENNTIELGRGEFISGNEVTSFTSKYIAVKYQRTDLVATHMYIVFVSSTSESPKVKNVTGDKGALDGFTDAKRIGSILTVDEIQLNYD